MKNRKKITTMSIRKVYNKLGDLHGEMVRRREYWENRRKDWVALYGEEDKHSKWLSETAREYGYIATRASLLAFSLYEDYDCPVVTSVHRIAKWDGMEKGYEKQGNLF